MTFCLIYDINISSEIKIITRDKTPAPAGTEDKMNDRFEEQVIAHRDTYPDKNVGDTTYASYGSFATGHITHKITRIDDKFIYGYVLEDTMRELTLADVI